jgi:hypothetical protein
MNPSPKSTTITSLDTQYTMLVKSSYASVSTNVKSSIGHHKTMVIPTTCYYEKKK